MDDVKQVLRAEQIPHFNNQNITVATLEEGKAFTLAQQLFDEVVERKAALYLSGGRTPKALYQALATSETLHSGAVAMVDERYGPKWHSESNEQMLKDTGLLRYLEMLQIPFYPILQGELSREETADQYDQTFRTLLNTYQEHIALLGIGMDGHTAGIAGNRSDFTNPIFDQTHKNAFYASFNDENGMFKERITMTFLGLSMMDLLIVLVFGKDKLPALQAVFAEGPEEEIPGRFLKRPEIAAKVLLLTDQEIA